MSLLLNLLLGTLIPLLIFSNNTVAQNNVLISQLVQEATEENSNKDFAYNTKSEKGVGEVAMPALENSHALIPCSENPSLCTPSQTPTPTLTPFPTPTSTSTPTPTFTPIPKPSPCPEIYKCPLNSEVMPCLTTEFAGDSFSRCGCPCSRFDL